MDAFSFSVAFQYPRDVRHTHTHTQSHTYASYTITFARTMPTTIEAGAEHNIEFPAREARGFAD